MDKNFDKCFDEFDFDIPFEIDGFEFDHGDFVTAVKTEIAPVMRYPRPPESMVMYERAEELADATPDLGQGDCMYAIVSGNFIFGDYLEALMVRKNMFAREMTIATLSLGQENADSLKNLFEGGYVESLTLIVSDYWYAHERRKEGGVPYLIDNLGKYDFRLAVAGIHTKIAIIRTECGKWLVMSGSANLRSSRNIEQFTIENNKTLYDFNMGWMGKIVEHYSAVKKSARGGKLWLEVAGQAEKDG